jgi:hypothetical protein
MNERASGLLLFFLFPFLIVVGLFLGGEAGEDD